MVEPTPIPRQHASGQNLSSSAPPLRRPLRWPARTAGCDAIKAILRLTLAHRLNGGRAATRPVARARRSERVGSLAFLRPRRATFHVVFVEYALVHGVRRPVEPPFGFRFRAAKPPAQFGLLAADLDLIETDGNDRARAN